MQKSKKKTIRNIKKSHTWVVLILFTLFSIVIIAGLVFSLRYFVDYAVSTKLMDKYSTIEYMAEIYGEDKDDPEVYETLNEAGVDYLIKDKSGKRIYSLNAETCDDTSVNIYLASSVEKVRVYRDSENDYFDLEENSNLGIKYRKVYRKLLKNNFNRIGDELENGDTKGIDETHDVKLSEKSVSMIGENPLNDTESSTSSEAADDPTFSVTIDDPYDTYDEEDIIEENKKFNKVIGDAIQLPIWVSADVNDGEAELVGKAVISLNMGDFAMIVIIMTLLVVILISVFIILLVIVINDIRNRKRAVKIFFTDSITGGHNWIWYTYMGDFLLRRRFNSKNNYAIVNLVFMKYRTYCVCHSIEDGEKLLKKVYQCIAKNLKKKELLAHATSSNFALLLKYDNPEKLQMRLYKLIGQLEKISDEHEHAFTFQIGVDLLAAKNDENGKVVNRKDVDIEFLYNNACEARASLGENNSSGVAIFDEELVKQQKWIDEVTEEQKNAIANEEFLVYYQPKYNPNTNELRGAEALVRWQSSRLGFVTPNRFIPIFEKNGFITELDHYMIEHVARDQKRWLDQGYNCVPISVNVSRAHFIESDLAEQIRDIVDREGAPHELVEIELTESAFFDDKKALLTTVGKLQEYGFSVSMDDFGSGYSSLNSLKDMPLDVLKIDAEFFRGENVKSRGKVVVAETIKLAKNLDMQIVAEGVEEKEIVDFLADLDCDMIQGYYYSKPLPKQEYEEKMRGENSAESQEN